MSLMKNVGALSIANIVVQVIMFVYSFVLRMILSPQLTGIWNLARLVLGYLSTATSGIGVGSERKIPILRGEGREVEAEEVRSNLFSYTLVESLLLALLVWGSIIWRKDAYESGEFWAIAAGGVYAVLTRLMSCYVIAFRTIHQFVNLSRIMVFFSVLDVVVILPAIYFFSLYGLLVGFGISGFLKLVWVDRIRRKKRIFNMGWQLHWSSLKDLLSVGFPIMVGNYFWKLFVTLDSLLIVWLMGTTSLAYYTVGAAMMVQLSEIPTNVSTVLTPRLFEKFGKFMDAEAIKPDLRNFFSGTLLCVAPLLCIIGFFGIPFLVRNLIPKFAEGIIVVKILIFAIFFIPQTHIPNQLLILNKARVEYSRLIIAGIAAISLFILVFYTIEGSMAAVALGTLAGYGTYFFVLIYRVLRRFFDSGEVWWVYRRAVVSVVWSSSVLLGVSHLFPGQPVGVLGDLLHSIGQGIISMILIAPLVWFGGSEMGLIDYVLSRHRRRRCGVETIEDFPAG